MKKQMTNAMTLDFFMNEDENHGDIPLKAPESFVKAMMDQKDSPPEFERVFLENLEDLFA